MATLLITNSSMKKRLAGLLGSHFGAAVETHETVFDGMKAFHGKRDAGQLGSVEATCVTSTLDICDPRDQTASTRLLDTGFKSRLQQHPGKRGIETLCHINDRFQLAACRQFLLYTDTPHETAKTRLPSNITHFVVEDGRGLRVAKVEEFAPKMPA